MNQSPYKVNFKYPIGTKERLLFEQQINEEPLGLQFVCSITAGTQIQYSNSQL